MTKNAIKDALKNRLGADIAGDFRVLKEHELAKFNDEAILYLKARARYCASFISLQIQA